LQKVWEKGGIQVSETATLMCNASQKRRVTDEFVIKKNYREESATSPGLR
jgi:hypothetical protein